MENGSQCIDHEARRLIAALDAAREACVKAREKEEVNVSHQLFQNTKELKNLKSGVDQLHGSMKAWKLIIPLCMLLIAAVTLLVNLTTK